VKIRRHDFATFSRQRAIAPPTQEELAVRNVARELLSRWLAEHSGAKLRLLGVVLTDLSPASQLGLFDRRPEQRPTGPIDKGARDPRLDSTVDEVRARFGRGALRRGNTIE
jgi:DNA polymerase-4